MRSGAKILELGSGAGRITRPLVALGFQVTAVDVSREMLAHIEGARTVCSRIEELALPERFDCVLLMSNLVNTPNDERRHAFLRCCRLHVATSGIVLVERLAPDLGLGPLPPPRTLGRLTVRTIEFGRKGPFVSGLLDFDGGARPLAPALRAARAR